MAVEKYETVMVHDSISGRIFELDFNGMTHKETVRVIVRILEGGKIPEKRVVKVKSLRLDLN